MSPFPSGRWWEGAQFHVIPRICAHGFRHGAEQDWRRGISLNGARPWFRHGAELLETEEDGRRGISLNGARPWFRLRATKVRHFAGFGRLNFRAAAKRARRSCRCKSRSGTAPVYVGIGSLITRLSSLESRRKAMDHTS
jgi:hypothetical protein